MNSSIDQVNPMNDHVVNLYCKRVLEIHKIELKPDRLALEQLVWYSLCIGNPLRIPVIDDDSHYSYTITDLSGLIDDRPEEALQAVLQEVAIEHLEQEPSLRTTDQIGRALMKFFDASIFSRG